MVLRKNNNFFLAIKNTKFSVKIWSQTPGHIQYLVLERLLYWAKNGPTLIQIEPFDHEVPQAKRMHKWNIKRLFDLKTINLLLNALIEENVDTDTREIIFEIFEVHYYFITGEITKKV